MTTQKRLPIVWIIFGLVSVALIVTIIVTFDAGSSGGEFGSPTVTGTPLPPLTQDGADTAVGLKAPEVEGKDYSGNTVSISDDGQAKIIVFLAHWCPHCQNEVPVVTDWLNTDPLPEGIDFYSVSTSISSSRDNYPPSAWLDRENWPAPVIADSEDSIVGASFGLPAFPYWVFLDNDNTVMGRLTGEISPNDLNAAVAAMLNG